MGKEFDYTSFDQGHLVKNLLSDRPFSKDDRMTVLKHRSEIDRLEDEKKEAADGFKAKIDEVVDANKDLVE